MTAGDNGLPPGDVLSSRQPSPEEQTQLILAAMLKDFVPPIDDDTALQLAIQTLSEQSQLATVAQNAVDPTQRKSYPIWGVKISNRGSGQLAAHMEAHKNPRKAQYVGEHMEFAQICGLLLIPAIRAVLYELGYRVEFYQSREAIKGASKRKALLT